MSVLPDRHWPTPGRKTHIWFDLNKSFVTEPAYSFGRPSQNMFQDQGSGFNNLEYTSGWGIKAYQENIDILLERTEAQSSAYLPSNSNLIVADHFIEEPNTRAPSSTEMPGATTGASANLAGVGIAGLRKAVPAGVNLSAANLSADQAAYPFTGTDNPYSIDDTIKLDRVAKTTDNDSPELALALILDIHGGSLNSPGYPGRIYFTAPAGQDSNGTGIGQYALNFTSQGQCNLFEKLVDNSWVKRFSFASDFNIANNTYFYLKIYKSKECTQPGSGTGGYIKFDFSAAPTGQYNHKSSLIGAIGDVAMASIARSYPQRFQYNVPGDGSTTTVPAPIRLDLRRDLSAWFSLSRFKYPTTMVTADDTPFEMLFVPSEDNTTAPFHFYYSACVPTGCTGYATLHRADTGAELTVISSEDWHTVYETVAGVYRFFVRIHLQSNGVRTPIFMEWRLDRWAILQSPGIPSWEIGDSSHPLSVHRNVNIRGSERDLSQETAEVVIVDPLNNLVELQTRASMPAKIETEYDPNDSSKRCTLFRGLAEVALGDRKSTTETDYPAVGWGSYNVQFNGEWQILDENFIDTPITSLYDPRTGIPYKVTDFIQGIISRCGYDFDDDFDFPTDIDTRLFAAPFDYSQTLDMLDKVSEVVRSLARDYLAHHLIFDANVGVNGYRWRLIPPATSPFTNLCEFLKDAPGNNKLVHYLPSYSGGEIPQAPIVKNTYKPRVKAPEGNWLVVASIGAFNTSTPQVYCTPAIWNPLSFNYLGVETADPSSPDYLGRRKPIYAIDTALGTANSEEELIAATDALARRIADLSFHGIKLLSFDAPLILVTHESDETKVRPLRYYDPVLVDGEQWLIRNVNPNYHKDGIMYATYELESPRF